MIDTEKKEIQSGDWIGGRFKNIMDNNYLLSEHGVGYGIDVTSYLLNEITRLKKIITHHQKKEQEYEAELNKILAE